MEYLDGAQVNCQARVSQIRNFASWLHAIIRTSVYISLCKTFDLITHKYIQ